MLLLAFWCEGSDEYMFPSQNVVLYIYTPAMETSSLKALSIWLVDANYIYLYIVNLICLCQISFSLNMFRIVCQNHFKSQDDVDILFTVPFCMLVDMDHKYPIYRCFNFLTFQTLQYTLEDCWNQTSASLEYWGSMLVVRGVYRSSLVFQRFQHNTNSIQNLDRSCNNAKWWKWIYWTI